MLAFIMAHAAAFAGVGVALLDFAIELNPKVEQNGIISLILGLLKKASGK